MTTRAKNRKIFKQHLLLGQWPDFKIFAQKFFGPLPKLLKLLCSAEQNGLQGKWLECLTWNLEIAVIYEKCNYWVSCSIDTNCQYHDTVSTLKNMVIYRCIDDISPVLAFRDRRQLCLCMVETEWIV